jgi:hypothetical protein
MTIYLVTEFPSPSEKQHQNLGEAIEAAMRKTSRSGRVHEVWKLIKTAYPSAKIADDE